MGKRRSALSDVTSTQLKNLAGNKKLIVIDEAQRVKNIGITIKLFTDQLPGIQVIVTGSSSLDLANEINEPLTGRKYEFNLFPISWGEYLDNIGALDANRTLEQRILYGMYPEIISKPAEKEELLRTLTDSYLFKDLLSFKEIRKPELLEKLVKALALQISRQVSYHELGAMLQVDKDTISKYIELLEKSFVIFRLPPFSRNLRSEISRMRKIYFYDTGVRNAIISNFKTIDLRNDAGALWENFIIAERLKWNSYNKTNANMYFWRTQQQQEIDLIEENGDKLSAFEIKWGMGKAAIPRTFLSAYPGSDSKIITRENYSEFLK
jgi:predicted AAA+ superfamily ATPase